MSLNRAPETFSPIDGVAAFALTVIAETTRRAMTMDDCEPINEVLRRTTKRTPAFRRWMPPIHILSRRCASSDPNRRNPTPGNGTNNQWLDAHFATLWPRINQD
jgi:hypothetical protein